MSRLAWLSLYLAAAFSFLIEGGWLVHSQAPELERLPTRLGALETVATLPVEPAVLGDQPPERHSYQVVRDPAGREGQLFIAYYRRAQRWSGRPHDVEKCYAAAGWQELEAHRLGGPNRPWSRLFERGDERLRVIHWLERPGCDSEVIDWSTLCSRFADGRGFRQDVASLYLEFPAEAVPEESLLEAAVEALSSALESLW